MQSKFHTKVLLGSLALSLLNIIVQFIFTFGQVIDSYTILLQFLSNFLVVLVLGFYVSHSSLKGLKLALSVFTVYFLIGHFNLLVEAYVFNVADRSETLTELLQGFFLTLLFAPILVFLFTKWEGKSTLLRYKNRHVFGWTWRIFLGIFLYLVFYLTAGIILQATYPGLMDFYKDKLPALNVMILTQFPRGLLFVIITIIILRTSTLPFTKRVLLIAAVFSILGGISPLIPPSQLMPYNIRLVHGFEVGISNFLYGIVVSYLLAPKRTRN